MRVGSEGVCVVCDRTQTLSLGRGRGLGTRLVMAMLTESLGGYCSCLSVCYRSVAASAFVQPWNQLYSQVSHRSKTNMQIGANHEPFRKLSGPMKGRNYLKHNWVGQVLLERLATCKTSKIGHCLPVLVTGCCECVDMYERNTVMCMLLLVLANSDSLCSCFACYFLPTFTLFLLVRTHNTHTLSL